jgi:hypothetical protein
MADDYKYTHIRYPDTLGGFSNDGANGYSNDSVVFFINVAAASKNMKNTTYGTSYNIPDTDIVKNSGRQITAAITPSTVGGATMRRLSTAIALYMPNSINNVTSVDWGNEDMSGAFQVGADIAMAGAGADGLLSGASAVASATAAASSKAMIAANKTAQNNLRVTPGNSKEELLFRSVEFRTFDFSYVFAPKSDTEATTVLNIIRMFRHHMLPEYKDDQEFMFLYPSEFNVKYMHNGKENPYLSKHITSVLLSVSTDYTPNGQWNSFAGGFPQQINMTLRFKELGIPTKETVPFDGEGL